MHTLGHKNRFFSVYRVYHSVIEIRSLPFRHLSHQRMTLHGKYLRGLHVKCPRYSLYSTRLQHPEEMFHGE